MGNPSGFYLFMLLPPLLAAFIIQFFVSVRVRGKIIIRTAVAWTAPILVISAIAGSDPLDILVRAAIFGGVGLAFALIGALIGSELSTLTRRLLGRSAS